MAWNVADAAKELNYKYYFISINLNVNGHVWLLATMMDRRVISSKSPFSSSLPMRTIRSFLSPIITVGQIELFAFFHSWTLAVSVLDTWYPNVYGNTLPPTIFWCWLGIWSSLGQGSDLSLHCSCSNTEPFNALCWARIEPAAGAAETPPIPLHHSGNSYGTTL